MNLIESAKKLSQNLEKLTFPENIFTYNPLTYAWEAHEQYLNRYGENSAKEVFFLGMNPGPFGMVQTGIPFGDVSQVKNYLHICSGVISPKNQHPKRPILGFNCPRKEVSGDRLWSLFKEMFGEIENFSQTNFVANFCPIAWLSESGANLTPDKLSASLRKSVENICQNHLIEILSYLHPKVLIGVGKYAEKQLQDATQYLITTQQWEKSPIVGGIIHPSPASPISNKSWPKLPKEQILNLLK